MSYDYKQICEKVFTLNRIPMILTDGSSVNVWPDMPEGYIQPGMLGPVLENFRGMKSVAPHPMVMYFEPGFLLGMAELPDDTYIIAGLVSPLQHSRQEILSFCAGFIVPSCLQQFCDLMQMQPLMTLQQLKDYLCLLIMICTGQNISPEQVMFRDMASVDYFSTQKLERELFDQREEAQFHVPVDYEAAICHAIEEGSMDMLQKSLHAPNQGRVGKMANSVIQQHRYELISLATLISRAAIRGGLPAETSFSLSDIYCQRADLLTEVEQIQRLTYAMMLDFCTKVSELRSGPSVSPLIQKCIDYISVHLHEQITLDLLSRHCGLCGRILSIRFRKETGLGINEYIHREKLREAQYLLHHTDYTLSEITLYLHYPSQSYFTHIFHKYTGMTPLQYREGPSR